MYPHLDIVQGDVNDLPYPDNYFSGILSLGVIEHIIEGMDKAISEMYRVLKKDGYALVIVPSYNTLRSIKHPLKVYRIGNFIRGLNIIRKILNKPTLNHNPKPISVKKKWKYWSTYDGYFYEYRLTKKQFENELAQAGFKIVESVPTSQIDGLYHEISKLLVPLDNHTFNPTKVGRYLNATLSRIPFFHNHMHLCVVQKT